MEKSESGKLPPELDALQGRPDASSIPTAMRRLIQSLGPAIDRIKAAASTGDMAAVRLTIEMCRAQHDLVLAVACGNSVDVEHALAECRRLAA